MIGRATTPTNINENMALLIVISFFTTNIINTGTIKKGKKKYDVPYEYADIPAITNDK